MSTEEREELQNTFKKNNRYWGLVIAGFISLGFTCLGGVVKWAANDVKTAVTQKVDKWDAAADKIQTVAAKFGEHESKDSAFMVRLCRACPQMVKPE